MSTVEAGPIRNRLSKAGLRLILRSRRRKATAEQRAAIDKVLDNDDLFDAVFDALAYEHSQYAGGPLTDLLDWIIANFDDILALIMKIIPLFT